MLDGTLGMGVGFVLCVGMVEGVIVDFWVRGIDVGMIMCLDLGVEER